VSFREKKAHSNAGRAAGPPLVESGFGVMRPAKEDRGAMGSTMKMKKLCSSSSGIPEERNSSTITTKQMRDASQKIKVGTWKGRIDIGNQKCIKSLGKDGGEKLLGGRWKRVTLGKNGERDPSHKKG